MQQHYGETRMTVGDVLNWQGRRYQVVSVEHMADVDRLVYVPGSTMRIAGLAHMAYRTPAHHVHMPDQRSVYTIRGAHGALYTVHHVGGNISHPKRVKDTIVGA